MEKKEKVVLMLLSAALLCGCVSQPAEEAITYPPLNVSSPAFWQNEKDAGKKEVLEAMRGHILAKGEVVGTYSK